MIKIDQFMSERLTKREVFGDKIVKTQFTKQDLIDLCNNFASFFNGLICKNEEKTNSAKTELIKILDMSHHDFCLLILKIPEVKSKKEAKTISKIKIIEKLHITEDEIIELASELGNIAVHFDGKKETSKKLLIPFFNFLYNVLNLDANCCKDFIISLHHSVDPNLN